MNILKAASLLALTKSILQISIPVSLGNFSDIKCQSEMQSKINNWQFLTPIRNNTTEFMTLGSLRHPA